jgi:hypothetical protein
VLIELQKQQYFVSNSGLQNGPLLRDRSQNRNTISIAVMLSKAKRAKVNCIKLKESGDGVPVRVGQSYQFWIGGYWL